jgi:two-component system cell cycle sensor histidine kinase/response regulator CckA
MMRVLVVDDNEENLCYLSTLLRAHALEVILARHGAEALVKARQAPPTLVISDLLMPVMDGYTLLRHWKDDARLRAIPFVVYTATYIEPEDEQLALDLGADAFILKPAEPEALLARIRAVQGRAPASIPAPTRQLPREDHVLLREYSERLIRKLEQKTLQLEASNQSLAQDVAARALVELALRESEANFRLLTEAMPQLVLITGVDGSHIFCNQRWVEYTGDTLAESKGDGWMKALHPDDRPLADAAWKDATDQGGMYSLEARIRKIDGSFRWWLVRGLPLRDSTGDIVKWIATCTDIDELKESAMRLQRTEEQLRQAQKMEAVGRLAAGVAHDFNNVLSVILGYTTLVIDDLSPDDPHRADIVEVQRAGVRATDLTRQLLAFSRQQVLEPRVLRLTQVLGDMRTMVQRLLGEDIDLLLLTAEPVNKVHADPSQIEQIVMNLAVNARDAMPNGGKLTIETANVEFDASYAADHPGVVPGPYVMLAVSDTGTGMLPSTRDRIFDPFFTTKEQGKGTGLGLSTVFGIVKQSAGHIYVYTEPGVGTTFKVYLPATDRASEAMKVSLPPQAALRGSETILLVEDDEQVRRTNCAILRRSGYVILDAQNGGEAFLVSEKFSAPIDLLLTDVVMPRMSGRELSERLAPARPEMKVLYISGYTENAISRHGVLDPGLSFLQKPIVPDVLLRKVREVLSTR